jgi:hypothetical protein
MSACRSARSRPGQSIPWHYHTVITDTTYCIEGTVQVEMLGPPERVLLEVGESHAVPTNRPTRSLLTAIDRAAFSSYRASARYDRHPVDPKTWEPGS